MRSNQQQNIQTKNYLRAFTDQNIVYTPVYISQEDYDTIINSPMETGK